MSKIIMLGQNLIDLSSITTPAGILSELSNILKENDLKNNKIKLVLGSILLTPAHVHDLKSVLESSEVEIELIYTDSVHTQLAALESGLIVSPINRINLEKSSGNQDLYEQQCSTTEEEILEEIINQETIEKKIEKSFHENNTNAMYLRQTLRSGQTVNFDGNIVLIGDCNPGSEIIASGDIIIWGILGGIAHAGSKGDYTACIKALKINAIQLRIADLFARKPDRLDVEKIEKTNTFMPEEAKILDGEIIIYPLNN
ncbi:MAG: septum site-determining protein MinC [bacterium]